MSYSQAASVGCIPIFPASLKCGMRPTVIESTPLQHAIRLAVARSGKKRDHFDRLLQEKLGTKGKLIYDIDRGKSKSPSLATIESIASVFGLPVSFFLNGGDEVEEPRLSVPDQLASRSLDLGEVVEIPRLDLSLPMGPGATVDDFVESEPVKFDLSYVRSFTRTPPHRLRLAGGAGDSMFPTLVPNDLVWIDTTQNQLLHADRIYAASINGGAAIKRLRPMAGGRRVLVISDNKLVEPYEVDAAEVVIWGRVIRFARDL